ncbi:MAG: DEAD/DEAH box helicase, partial [Thalassospira sp.]
EQSKVLEKGADVIIATPGRLIDTFERGKLLLSDCKLLVIDEADRMLDMGFIPDIEKIVNMLPKQRQTLFFSATMPKEIKRLADKFLSNPKEITVSPPSTMATTVEHKLLVLDDFDKREALRRLIRAEDVRNAFVFCNRKKDVDILYKSLTKHGFNAGRMHGDLAQSERTETLAKFKTGEITLLVCSDVAARGIDVADVSHVFNFDVPFNAEDYVHRTGRTGRAGRDGKAFTLAVPEDGKLVAAINKSINMDIPLTELEGIETLELDFTGKKRRNKKSRKPTNTRDDKPARPARSDKKEAVADTPSPAKSDEQPQKDADAPKAPARDARNNAGNTDRNRTERPDRTERNDRNDRNNRNNRRDRDDRDDKTVIGFGDHVPSFLLTEVPASSLGKKPSDDEEEAPKKTTTAKRKPAAEKSKSTTARKPRRSTKKASDEAPAEDAAPAATEAPAETASDAKSDAAPAKEVKKRAPRRPRKKAAPKAETADKAADTAQTSAEPAPAESES